ncbi:MAG: hypothetical protein RL441_1015 [Actinomycetota bacterium]
MRLTDFWQRMNDHFGAGYARSWARDTRLSQLGGQTVEEALAAGVETQDVWRAVWAYEKLPARDR